MCMYEGKALTRCGCVIISINKGKGGIWFLVLLEERRGWWWGTQTFVFYIVVVESGDKCRVW